MNKLVKRSDKVAYFGVPQTDGSSTFMRMTGFTEMAVSKNAEEYSRQYVDEKFKQTDVTGYSPSIAYGFDLYDGNAVHEDIVSITDNEYVGTEAVRQIIIVDFSTESGDGGYSAIKRDFAVVPDSEGDSTEAYTYSGTFKVKGEKVFGTVTSEDDYATINFA